MNKPTARFTLMLFLACAAAPLAAETPAYHYALRDDGFWIHNGSAYFNRPLSGTHEVSMLLSGDRPAFAYFAPGDVGKIGTLYIGLVTPHGGKWLDHFSEVDSLYQPGLTRHVLKDPELMKGALEVVAVPLDSVEGFTIRLRWVEPPSEKVRLVWAFGGASGYNVNYEALIAKLHLSEDDTAQDAPHVWGSRLSLTSPALKGKEIWGTCDLPGSLTLREPRAVVAGPMEAERAAPGTQPVVVFGGDWPQERRSIHLIFTMGGVATLEELAAHPAQTFDKSVEFYRGLAKRVQVRTPDPYFDLAVEAMVIANDGMWVPPSFVHGALSWMQHYVGWRIAYGSEVLGWHERVRSHILASAARQVQSGESRGAIPHMLEAPGDVFYNMNEIYLDDIYYNYLWTGDGALLASLFPIIQGILSWEKRRLDPDDNALYESCLNTWISDSHWYSGGDCGQATAYMFRGYQLAAEAAEAAGADPNPFRREAERIRAAMNDKLWLASSGHYAEFIDHLGLKRIHTEPELPTIYHPIDFGVTDQFQAYQMLRFTESNLRNETAIPNGGRLAWSSNWAPNYDKHYTHSTYDLVFAESLNLAIAYYRAGQFDKAYDLVKGVYASMYQGGIPGGLSCHAYSNGQQRANEEFGDAISMFARTAVEGVFGILPEMQHGIIHITPGFPKDWKEASISTPDLNYRFQKTESEIAIDVETVQPARVHYRVPLRDASAAEVWVNGSQAEAHIDAGIGGPFVDVTGPPAARSSLKVKVRPRGGTLRFQPVAATGERFTVSTDGGSLLEVKDPQAVLQQARLVAGSLEGTVTNKVGPHTLFVRVGDRIESAWKPVDVEVRPPVEILNPRLDPGSGACAFVLRNNTAATLRAKGTAHWAGKTTQLGLELQPYIGQEFRAEGDLAALLLGKNALKIAGLPMAKSLAAEVLYWPEAPPRVAAETKWKTLRLDQFYNDSLSTILSHQFWTSEADYPYAVCRDYMLAHLVGDRSGRPNDNALRARVNEAGIYVTHVGIPFAQRAVGMNVVAISRWKEFPDHISVPVEDAARKVYLLISGVTFPMQSQIANLRVVVNYADGGKSSLDLVNPDNFDTGWRGFYGGNYHYAANGMEVIGSGPREEKDDEARTMPIARPRTILAEQGVPEPLDYSKWTTATHADIVDVDCDPSRKIQDVTITVLSNEIIAALHGITLLK